MTISIIDGGAVYRASSVGRAEAISGVDVLISLNVEIVVEDVLIESTEPGDGQNSSPGFLFRAVFVLSGRLLLVGNASSGILWVMMATTSGTLSVAVGSMIS